MVLLIAQDGSQDAGVFLLGDEGRRTLGSVLAVNDLLEQQVVELPVVLYGDLLFAELSEHTFTNDGHGSELVDGSEDDGFQVRSVAEDNKLDGSTNQVQALLDQRGDDVEVQLVVALEVDGFNEAVVEAEQVEGLVGQERNALQVEVLEGGALCDDELEESVGDLHAVGQIELGKLGKVLGNFNERLDRELVRGDVELGQWKTTQVMQLEAIQTLAVREGQLLHVGKG